jgi:hypothetical protein
MKMKHIGTQKLETDRLILRRFTEADDEVIWGLRRTRTNSCLTKFVFTKRK